MVIIWCFLYSVFWKENIRTVDFKLYLCITLKTCKQNVSKVPNGGVHRKNFAKFTEKYLNQSLFLLKLQVPGLKLKTPTKLFSNEFGENVKNIFCIKHLRLLLNVCLPVVTALPYKFRRINRKIKCRRFNIESTSTWSQKL